MRQMLWLMVLSAMGWAAGVIEVRGTSSWHDWTMVSDTVPVYMETENGSVKTLRASMVIETLKSDNEALDDDAYGAFSVERDCPAVFTLSAQERDGSLNGVIKIGRHEKRVVLLPDRIENGTISGTFKVKMSSLGVTPPSLFAGMLTVEDTIEVRYTITDDGVPIPAVLLRCVVPPQQGMTP